MTLTLFYGVDWTIVVRLDGCTHGIENGGIHMILHRSTSNIHSCLGSPYGRQNVLNFLTDMQPLVLTEDNVHIYNSKSCELNCDYSCDTNSFL